jgi:hypothetical protein
VSSSHVTNGDTRPAADRLRRRGFVLEGLTLGRSVAGVIVLAVAALDARSVALAGFGLDSLIEIGASAVVIRELSGTGEDRQGRALTLIGGAFVALAVTSPFSRPSCSLAATTRTTVRWGWAGPRPPPR